MVRFDGSIHSEVVLIQDSARNGTTLASSAGCYAPVVIRTRKLKAK